MKIFAVILVSLLALLLWLAFLFVRYEPSPSAAQAYGPPLKEAMEAVFSPLKASREIPLGQTQALMERAARDAGGSRKKAVAELSLALAQRLLAAHAERERYIARLKQIESANTSATSANSPSVVRQPIQPSMQLKPGRNVKRLGQVPSAQASRASHALSAPDKSIYIAAEERQWAEYVATVRPQCEESLRRIVELEGSPSQGR